MQSMSFAQEVGFVAAAALRATHRETTPTKMQLKTNQVSVRADTVMRVPSKISSGDSIKCPDGAPRLKKMTGLAGRAGSPSVIRRESPATGRCRSL